MSFEDWLLCSVLTGVIGMAYFVYGKKQAKPVPLVAGLGLMVYPYFFDSWLWTALIGIALIGLPFLFIPSE